TVGGWPAPQVGKRRYALPGAHGGTVEATLRAGFADPHPTLEINGVRYPTGPKVPVVLRILVLLPLLLAVGAVGGGASGDVIGDVIGGGARGAIVGLVGWVGVMLNLLIARTGLHATVKAMLMMVIAALALLISLVLVAVIRAAAGQS